MNELLQLAGSEPAGGAAIWEVVVATAAAGIASGIVIAIGLAHRAGRVSVLGRVASWTETHMRLPGWAALPGEMVAGSLIVALVGMYWDISLHIDQGRDPGPLANPAHYLILIGLFGAFVAGFLAIVLGDERVGKSGLKISKGWRAPIGGVMLFACAGFSLLGFPLDDGWHRLFGQDVTLWGPTHLMLFGGAAMTIVGRSALLVEGIRAAGTRVRMVGFQRAAMCGAFLIGLSTFQGEFDFGVPQFRMVFQPVLILFAASVALVAARIWAGRGGALVAVAVFVGVRGFVSILVGPVFGETLPHFPLYIAEALLVELAALRFTRHRPLALGAVSGALIGTVGFAAEWGWSHIWMPIPWESSLLPEGLILGFATAVAGGLIGALLGAALASDDVRFPARSGLAWGAALATLFVVVGIGLQTSDPKGIAATVKLSDAQGGKGSGRHVNMRVKIEPPNAAKDAHWITATSWQGGGLVVDRLKPLGNGVYQTTEPVPVSGDWKTLIRLHTGDAILGVPVYLPRDAAIPAPEVPARAEFTRQFVPDKKILQREAKEVSGALTWAGYLMVLAIALGLLALITLGVRRLALDGKQGLPPDETAPVREPARRTAQLSAHS
jgi:hypothetical protein